jgi:hypothetical protein
MLLQELDQLPVLVRALVGMPDDALDPSESIRGDFHGTHLRNMGPD